MVEKRLNIVKTDNGENNDAVKKSYAGGKTRRLGAQAYFDRLWLVDPEQFDPNRNCMDQERLDRTQGLIQESISVKDKPVVDLGCGAGELSRRLRDLGAVVVAVDISNNALKVFKDKGAEGITLQQDYIPSTALKDDSFDLVICTELIAYLQPDEYRLLFSELSRLVKPEGKIVCSTPIDINSIDALQKFADLAETEIEIEKWVFSWNLCYIKIKNFFTAPSRFIRASKDKEYRLRELKQRSGLSHWWYKLNSTKPLVPIWFTLQALFYPLTVLIKKSKTFLFSLEKFCQFLWSDAGISHAIFIGKRRSFLEHLPADQIPIERKHRRQVWE